MQRRKSSKAQINSGNTTSWCWQPARAFVPPVAGSELMLTLNSQQEYQACEAQLRDAQRVLIIGGGLIGSELAMDFCRAGKAVTLVDSEASILFADAARSE
jgi:NADPH-dependent 2,4-dienoyl-CoA reductase/sulfur reductase-like enzyme